MNLYKDDLPANLHFTGSVAVDTESMGLVVKRDRLCLVQLCSAEGDVHIVQIQQNNQHKAENLKKLLTDKSILKIFHYARFDISILNYTFDIKVNPIYCTKIASKLCRTYTDKHGLKNLCKDILGIELSKQEQTSDWGKNTLSNEQLKYAAGDVIHLHALKNKLNEIIIREGKADIMYKCFDAVNTISELDLKDIAYDTLFNH